MSVSALVVNAHGALAQQVFDHLQVFSIGAGAERRRMHLASQRPCIPRVSCCRLPVKHRLAEDVLFTKAFCARQLDNLLDCCEFPIITSPGEA